MTPVERKELGLLDTLQDSIMNRNKEKGESKNLTSDELLGKMIRDDLKALPPISKLQARNEIQNIIFKYRMGSMQDSLQRKLNSTASIDGSSPSKNAGQFASKIILEMAIKVFHLMQVVVRPQIVEIIEYMV